MVFLAGVAGVIDINGTVIVELITFLVMTAILARYVHPAIVKLAEAPQRQVPEQLKDAEREGHRGGCEWQRPPLGATRGRCSSMPRRRGESMSGCAISRPSAISWAIPLWLQCSRTRPFPPRAAWS